MNLFAQRIAFEQQGIELAREARDHGDFQAKAEIVDLRPEGGCPARPAARSAPPRLAKPLRSAGEAFAAPSASASKALRGKHILRNINAIEIAIVGAAVLQMIDDLERRAQRVRGGPGRFALAMHVENEAPDRRRRIGAIVHEFGPIRIALLDRIHPEGAQKIERMTGRQFAARRGQRAAAARLRSLSLRPVSVASN